MGISKESYELKYCESNLHLRRNKSKSISVVNCVVRLRLKAEILNNCNGFTFIVTVVSACSFRYFHTLLYILNT